MVPPALDQTQQDELKGAVEQPPAAAGIQLANWYWRVVRQFVSERFGISLCRSSCLNWRYRLGFACQRLKQRLRKANESKREGLRGGVRRPVGGGLTDGSQNILCR